jgi:dCMP deaminase
VKYTDPNEHISFDPYWNAKRGDTKMTRKKYPTFEETIFTIANTLARRSTCPRKHVGCVITDEFDSIVAAGYNGPPSGMPTCMEVGCLLEGGHCVRTVHAEMAALASAARRGVTLRGCVAWCTLLPCIQCLQALVTAGITIIYYDEEYERSEKDELFKLVGRLNVKLIGSART